MTTGAEKFAGPVVIQAAVPVTGWGSINGVINFNPLRHNQRPALLLVKGVVYIAWASHGLENELPYPGWIIGYNATTMAQVAAYVVTPNGEQGGIWQSGAGLAGDTLGNVFFISGNGTFDAEDGGSDYGMSFVKLSTGTGLTVADYFTAYNEAILSNSDIDLGSGGVILLPYETGVAHPYLAIGAVKNGVIYLLDRTNMGHFNSSGNQQIGQSITNAFDGHALYSTPAYWNEHIYFWADHDVLRIFARAMDCFLPLRSRPRQCLFPQAPLRSFRPTARPTRLRGPYRRTEQAAAALQCSTRLKPTLPWNCTTAAREAHAIQPAQPSSLRCLPS